MENIAVWVEDGGLWALFGLIALEYACFPLPSEVLLPFAGAVCARGGIGLGVIYALSVAAGLLGCSVCYWVGRVGGGGFLAWFAARVPKSRSGIAASQRTFGRYAHWAVMAGRMVPVCRTYISFIAGAGGQSFGAFLAFSAVGIAVWNILLLSAGYFLGERWGEFGGIYGYWQGIVAFLALVVLFLFLKGKLAGKKMRKG